MLGLEVHVNPYIDGQAERVNILTAAVCVSFSGKFLPQSLHKCISMGLLW